MRYERTHNQRNNLYFNICPMHSVTMNMKDNLQKYDLVENAYIGSDILFLQCPSHSDATRTRV